MSKIIVNVKKLTGRLRGAMGELPQEISSRGGGYTTCKFNIFKNDKCQKNELRFKRGSGVESIRGAGHNKNPKPNFFFVYHLPLFAQIPTKACRHWAARCGLHKNPMLHLSYWELKPFHGFFPIRKVQFWVLTPPHLVCSHTCALT